MDRFEVISIDRAAFNQGENAKYSFSVSGGVSRRPLWRKAPERSATEDRWSIVPR